MAVLGVARGAEALGPLRAMLLPTLSMLPSLASLPGLTPAVSLTADDKQVNCHSFLVGQCLMSVANMTSANKAASCPPSFIIKLEGQVIQLQQRRNQPYGALANIVSWLGSKQADQNKLHKQGRVATGPS